ncbi:MAG TPA: hypothetical protein VGG39_23405 [Polyangiaceae bacterium]|jgi:hypothetical protein
MTATDNSQLAKEPEPAARVAVADVLALMAGMREHGVAYIEMPGVLRMGVSPEPKTPAARHAQPNPTPEEAIRRMTAQRESLARQRRDEAEARKARLAVTSTGGIVASNGRTLDTLADQLASEAAASLQRPIHDPPEGTPATGDETALE